MISPRTMLKNLAMLGMAGTCGVLFPQKGSAGQMDFAAHKGKILIAYFSRTGENYGVGNISKGNTEIVAELIQQKTGGDLLHVEPAFAYPIPIMNVLNSQKKKKMPALDLYLQKHLKVSMIMM